MARKANALRIGALMAMLCCAAGTGAASGAATPIKVFHGLRPTTIEPESVALIGEPADIPYEERIYRVAFDLDNVPMADRVVLEVLAPSGERLCKFHLDLE